MWVRDNMILGLEDNLSFGMCLTGSSRGRGTNGTAPLVDMLQALACALARDLDIGQKFT